MKRTIYQCDRCSKTREQENRPVDWVTAEIKRSSSIYILDGDSKLWCMECWAAIKAVLPLAVKA